MDVIITEIPPETLNALRSLARKNGKTLEEYARSILEQATQNSSEMDEVYQNLIEQDLAELDESESKHLEKEFEAVKSNNTFAKIRFEKLVFDIDLIGFVNITENSIYN